MESMSTDVSSTTLKSVAELSDLIKAFTSYLLSTLAVPTVPAKVRVLPLQVVSSRNVFASKYIPPSVCPLFCASVMVLFA